jgi:uncharacterized membrane protein
MPKGRRNRSDMMKIRKKTFWILAILYAAVTLLLNNVLHTAIGEFLMQISYLALALGIIFFIYKLLKISIKQFFYNQKKNK